MGKRYMGQWFKLCIGYEEIFAKVVDIEFTGEMTNPYNFKMVTKTGESITMTRSEFKFCSNDL